MAAYDLFTILPSIEAGELILREISPAEAVAIFEAISPSPVGLRLFRDAHDPDRDRSCDEPYGTHQLPPWSISPVGGNSPIGACGFLEWNLQHARSAFSLALPADLPESYQAGVFRSMIDFGFRIMELNRIEAPLGEGDHRLRRMADDAGMRFEGILRKELWTDGAFHDVALHAAVRREWSR